MHPALLVLLAALASPVQVPDEPAARALCDGRTLSGWDGDARYWSVEDGCIVGRSTADRPLARSTWLVWRGGELRDFELECEFRIVGGNSGLQFRSRAGADFQVAGPQADMEDGPSWTGCLYEQEGRGVMATRGEHATFGADGAKSVERFADADALLKQVRVHDWNRYRVVARGGHIELFVNGAKTVAVDDRDPARARAGVLALQLHQGPPMEVRYRNLTLRELPTETEAAPEAAAADERPQWIWTNPDAATGEQALFEKRFTPTGAVRTARLAGCADNAFEGFVNGSPALQGDDWTHPGVADVTTMLLPGENVLNFSCVNEGGPAAVQFALDLEYEDGTHARIVTDSSWSGKRWSSEEFAAGKTDEIPFAPVVVLGPLGVSPWGTLPAPAAVQMQALAAESIEVPEGFQVELVYSVPRARQGSWVAMTFDAQGRIIAADQYGPLWRVTLEGSAVAKTEKIDLVEGAQGLCVVDGSLYAVIAGEAKTPSGLYRLRDTDGDDRYDSAECLKRIDGSGEHGPHGIALGPDGKSLYMVAGNYTKLPEGIERYRVPPYWGEDQLLPQHEDPNGHAVGLRAPGGWICKCDLDGKHWELFAAGLRNSYDIAFDAAGELYTFDSDMEWDMGLPWYVPTRVCHVTSGADFGWRTGSSRWPTWYEDSLPGDVDIGPSSPTGICFGTNAGFPEEWRETLFAGDWAYGTIYAIPASESVRENGTSVMRIMQVADLRIDSEGVLRLGEGKRKFLSGKPLPITDMQVGPDGALWFTVGGRRTQSALYRVVWIGPSPIDAPEFIEIPAGGFPTFGEVPTFGPAEYEGPEGAEDRLIDAQGTSRDSIVTLAFDCMDLSNRGMRYTARTALESQDPGLWIPRAFAERRSWAAIEAMIALAHRAPASLRGRMLSNIAAWPIEQMCKCYEFGRAGKEDQLRAALRALELVLIRMGRPDEQTCRDIERRMDNLYPHPNLDTNRELCNLLVYLESPHVAAKSLGVMDKLFSETDQLALGWPLRTLRTGWTLDDRRHYFRWLNGLGASGGFSYQGYIADLRRDAVDSLTDEERAALGPLLEAPAAAEAGAQIEAPHFVKNWTVEELEPRLAASRSGRDFAIGKAAYQGARCLECHRIAGQGGGTGPDLTGAGSRFSERDLVEAMLRPSSTISDQYRDTEVVTKDDEVYVGRVVEDSPARVRLACVQPREEELAFDRADIAVVRPHALSRMPEGLLDALEEAQILDLIAYLRAGGDSGDTAFRAAR